MLVGFMFHHVMQSHNMILIINNQGPSMKSRHITRLRSLGKALTRLSVKPLCFPAYAIVSHHVYRTCEEPFSPALYTL